MANENADHGLFAELNKVEGWSKLFTILAGASGVVLALNGLLDFRVRISYWIVLAVICGIAAIRKRTVPAHERAPDAHHLQTARDPRWAWATVAFLLALVLDVGINFSYPFVLISTTPPMFVIDNGSMGPPSGAAPLGNFAVFNRKGIKPTYLRPMPTLTCETG